MFKIKKEDYIFIIPILVLLAFLIFRIIDKSTIIYFFPLDFTNDISSHIAKLHFLAEYGYHSIIPHWYAGVDFILFRSYPPGWYFFTLPLYYLFNNPQLATYISLVIIYILSLITIYLIGKNNKFSPTRSLMFFVLLYANPISIGYLLRVGKMPEMFGWLFGLISFAFILYYKDKKLNNKFIIYSLILAGWILSNFTSFIVSLPLLLGFFLVKKQKLYILLVGILAIIISSFWLFPFLTHTLSAGGVSSIHITESLLSPENKIDQITTWISSLILFATFFLYWKQKRYSKKELTFYSPLLVLGLLVFTRLIIYIPIFQSLHPDNFNIIFLIVGIFLFLKTKFKKRKLLALALIIISILCILASLYSTPLETEHTQQDLDTLELMEDVEGTLIIYGNTESFSRAFYSYGAIYTNTEAISGWFDQDVPPEWINELKTIDMPENNCEEFNNDMEYFSIESIIAYDEYCETIQYCREITEQKNNVCLFNF
jgi:hypothetical protein